MGSTVLRAVLAVVLVMSACACAGGSAPRDDLVDLAAAVPADLAARGMLLRRGVEGARMLIDQLGLPADEVSATLTTGAPAVHLLHTTAGARAADTLVAAGFNDEEQTPEGWRILVRPEGGVTAADRGDRGFVGVPAVAVGQTLIAVGSVEEVRAVAAGRVSLPVVEAVLAAADVALVQPPSRGGGQVSAGALPVHDSTVLTVAEDGTSGHLALRLPEEGTQDDAVGLAVRLRTAGPVDDGGMAVLTPRDPLTSGDVVSVEVRWSGDARERLGAGLGSGLLDFLHLS